MVDRKKLEEVGGVEDTLPGGDDFDLCIRLRKAGYTLVVDKSVYVYHYGCQTGKTVHGKYWDSDEHQTNVNIALINKHGLRTFWETRVGTEVIPRWEYSNVKDTEGDAVKSFVKGDTIIELGCGATKTVPESIGLDLYSKGQPIPTMENAKSVADIVCDVSGSLPFDDGTVDCIIARHILEHCLDPILTLTFWRLALKPDGVLILALPNEGLSSTIPMNVEHLHAFTPENLRSFAKAAGLKELEIVDPNNGVSFIAAYVPMESKDVVEATNGYIEPLEKQEVHDQHSVRGS